LLVVCPIHVPLLISVTVTVTTAYSAQNSTSFFAAKVSVWVPAVLGVKEYVFPSISQSGRQWMSLSPNELESMNAPLAQMRGRVAVFGLGLGYFAFMAAQKAEVCEICVVEREQQAIDLFKNQILPGLPNGEKIQIVQEDAFFFAKNSMKNAGFDTAFVDLWHDVSDGAAMYARMRALEKHSGGTRFSYWMENALLSNLRFRLVSMLMDADDGLPTPLLDYFCGADTIGLFSRVEALLDAKNLCQLAKIWPYEMLESV